MVTLSSGIVQQYQCDCAVAITSLLSRILNVCLICHNFRSQKMKKYPLWKNWCLNVWIYLQISSDCFTRGKPLQVPTLRPTTVANHTQPGIVEVPHQCMMSHHWIYQVTHGTAAFLNILYNIHTCTSITKPYTSLSIFVTDEHRLSDYSIGPEAKLNLVVRPAGERSGMASSSSAVSGVWQTLSTVLAKHFSPADAAKVQEQLVKVHTLFPLTRVGSCWYISIDLIILANRTHSGHAHYSDFGV